MNASGQVPWVAPRACAATVASAIGLPRTRGRGGRNVEPLMTP